MPLCRQPPGAAPSGAKLVLGDNSTAALEARQELRRAITRARAAAAELSGTIGTAPSVKKAVTPLFHNPWEPAPLLGFG